MGMPNGRPMRIPGRAGPDSSPRGALSATTLMLRAQAGAMSTGDAARRWLTGVLSPVSPRVAGMTATGTGIETDAHAAHEATGESSQPGGEGDGGEAAGGRDGA